MLDERIIPRPETRPVDFVTIGSGTAGAALSHGGSDIDPIVRSVMRAIGADAAVVTSLATPGEDAAIVSVVGVGLSDGILRHVARTASTGAARPISSVDGWYILNVPIRTLPDAASLVLSLVSRAPMWAPGSSSYASLEVLRPLIDAAFDAWQRVQVSRRGVAGLACALDGVDLGIMLLDRRGSVTFANRAGRELLDDGRYIRWSGDRVAGIGLREALALQVAIEHVITGNGAGDRSRHAPVLALRSKETGLSVIVSIVPVVARASMLEDTAAVMYVLDPRIDTTKQLQPVCSLYGLSPVESRLACLIAGGASLQDAAAGMRIKEQTARSYLKQVFVKTDTKRQADLVRVMLTSVLRTQREIDPVFLR